MNTSKNRSLFLRTVIAFTLVLFLYTNTSANAQEDSAQLVEEPTQEQTVQEPVSVTIIYDENCTKCDEIKSFVDAEIDSTKVDATYFKPDENADTYQLIKDTCKITGNPLPILVTSEKCFTNIDEIKATLMYIEKSVVLSNESQTDTDSGDPQEETNEETEDINNGAINTLQDILQKSPQQETDPLIVIGMLIIPAILITMFILLISKFKL